MAGTSISPVAHLYADKQLHDTLTVSGYGASVTVESSHLKITDGIGRARRERRIPRQPRSVQRLVSDGTTGYISFDAMKWLADTGIPWSQLSSDGTILATSAPAREDARLLRAQAYASHEQTGIKITKMLLSAKLAGQAYNLRELLHAPGAAIMIDEYADELRKCITLDDCRTWEGQAAITYWQVWSDKVKPQFSSADAAKMPEHWLRFDSRSSMIWDYPRNMAASDPTNALLNYIYRIAETEGTHACHSLGLSPLLGILHADKANRDSMSLDLIEAVRPFCDRIVLGTLDDKLDRRWFTESYQGQCWLVPPITHKLASFAALIGHELRPHAETVARILAGAARGDVKIPKARARKTTPPAMSKRPVRLRDGITVSGIITDEIWNQISKYIPEPPASPYGRRKTGRPRDVSADREVTAALAAHELLNVPWHNIPVKVSESTCRSRLLEWQWVKTDGVSAWDRISGELSRSGHLDTLTY